MIRLSLTALILAVSGQALASTLPQEPSNKLVAVIDGSGSFRTHVPEAVERTVSLLETMSQVERERWEPDSDRISVISLDALPEVIWEGTLQDLKAAGPDSWRKRFEARSDYRHCTDVGTAFRIATRCLDGDARYVGKYLLAFTDLLDEPPTISIQKCTEPRSIPEDFPWESLGDVSVSVFWVPPEQTLVWRRAVESHNLASTFHVHSTSESVHAEIPVPVRPKVELTDEELAELRAGYLEWGRRALWIGGGLVGAFLLMLGLAWGSARAARVRRRARRRAERPGPAGPYLVTTSATSAAERGGHRRS